MTLCTLNGETMKRMCSSGSGWIGIAFGLAMVMLFDGNALHAQGRGSLLVLADSGTTVYVDGQYQGMVMSAQEGITVSGLKPGFCGVVLRKSGAESEVYKVEIKRGRESILEKRVFRTMPVPAPRTVPTQSPAMFARQDSSGGVAGSERFVGLWREQREGTFGNAHFDIGLADGKFYVQRYGEQYGRDVLSPTGLFDKSGKRSFGVVKLEGKVRHYGGTISMGLVIHAVVKNPLTDLKSDTLAVQYWDIVGGGGRFTGSPKGYWVRIKQP